MKELFRIGIALWHARRIQDFLWNKPGRRTNDVDTCVNYEGWIKQMQKRVDRLSEVDKSVKSWKVEARKRALQNAGLSIAFIEYLDSTNGKDGDNE